MAYEIEISEDAKQQLRAIPANYEGIIRDKINEQLRHQPNVATRKRKPLRQPNVLDAGWELRVNPYRVYYNVDGAAQLVDVIAIGYKPRHEVFIDGKQVEL